MGLQFEKLPKSYTFALRSGKGSLAQLVQSICLTSRGSAVRTRVLPLNTDKGFIDLKPLSIFNAPTHFRHKSFYTIDF